jgi:hypothetical protein
MRKNPARQSGVPFRHRKAVAFGVISLGVAVAVTFPAAQALAAPTAAPVSASETTQANVDVSTTIALTDLTPSFTLSGLPGDTPTDDGAVTMNVMTNNATGYNVTVQSLGPNLSNSGPNNIPIADLQVDDGYSGGTAGWVSLSSTAPVQVFSQATPSSNTGDTIVNDYRMTIPAVPAGTYSGTLNYVASTNP